MLILTGCQFEEQSEKLPIQPRELALNSPEASSEESSLNFPEEPASSSLSALKPIVPIRIQIPHIQVDADVEKVGILENGQMGIPLEEMNIGWFEPGYKPGQNGSAVMAGHVDNKSGPSVFFYLKLLEVGDKVFITGEDGTTLTFIVKDLATYKTEESPIDYIFSKSDVPRLNLITCTGTFNKKNRSHEERLVVFTELNTITSGS